MNLAQYRADGTLRDGTPVVIRAIRPDDRGDLREGFLHLSDRTIYHRFLSAKRDLTDTELRYLTELDFRDHLGLVVELTAPREGHLIAVGRAVRTGSGVPSAAGRAPVPPAASAPGARSTNDSAEVAFVVEDEYQGRGVGTLLLEHLARMARELGYRTFEAEVLADNRQMLEVFAHSGLPLRERVRDGLVHVEMDL